jgi:leader peptidase (prepilin peptidase)/N-methyltransferase
MNPLTAITIGVAGALSGPWLRARVLVHAVPYGKPPHQHCPACGVLLVPMGWRGLLATLPPTGSCSHCRTPVGPAGWLTETLAATIATVLAWRAGSWWLLAAWLWVGLFGIALALVDLAVKRLPDQLTGVAALGALTALTAGTLAGASPAALLRAVLAAAGLTVFYLLLVLLPGTGLGAGDGKLAPAVGLCLGYLSLGAVVIATMAGTLLAACYVTVMLARRRIGRTDTVPYGPFMLLGALTAVLIAH